MLGAFFFLTHQRRAFLLVLASLLKRLHLFLCRCAASCHTGISSSPHHPAELLRLALSVYFCYVLSCLLSLTELSVF
ncbi:hypothetical protein KSP39_PZI016529 [Platanthera zijinensis]|uniref:Uncharacterized protein n=1 Tax=Platanthera zijinensis TaxID=2320716 RepID=A0AAP0G0S6_9ASPA